LLIADRGLRLSNISSAKTKCLLFETLDNNTTHKCFRSDRQNINKISFLSVAEERVLNLIFVVAHPFSANDGLEARCHSLSAGLICTCSYEYSIRLHINAWEQRAQKCCDHP
jgi:hypothetical protein